jgi:hypothetical protein
MIALRWRSEDRQRKRVILAMRNPGQRQRPSGKRFPLARDGEPKPRFTHSPPQTLKFHLHFIIHPPNCRKMGYDRKSQWT